MICQLNLQIAMHSIQQETIAEKQDSQIEDIFSLMQRKFDSSFNQIQLFSPDQQSIKHNKASGSYQIIHQRQRPTRKLKFEDLALQNTSKKSKDKKLNKSSDRTFQQSLSQFSDLKLTNQKISNKQPAPNIYSGSNSNSSPYGRIADASANKQIQNCPQKTDIDQSTRFRHGIQNFKNGNESTVKSTSILDYRDLQQKIDCALKKNAKYKDFPSNQRLGKSNFTSKSFNQFNQMLLSRFQQYEKKKQRQIQLKKQQLKQRQQKQLKFHPKINKKSQQFIEQMAGHQSIEHRYQKIIEAKNKKILQNQSQKRQKQETEYQKFMFQFVKFQKKPEQTTRSYDEFYEQMRRWKQKSNKNTEQKKRQIQQQQLKQSCDFRQKINKKSQQILIKSAKIEKRVPIHEREIPSEKRYKTKIDEECTFKPKINKQRVK